MNEQNNLSEIFRRAMETNLKFYSGLLDLSVNYLKNVGEIISEIPGQVNSTASPAGETSSAAIVLEAAANDKVHAPLMVENDLPREVCAEVSISAFTDSNGVEHAVDIQSKPASMTLQPGEKTLIQIHAMISEDLEEGMSYRGFVTIPELSENSIPIVVRRLSR